MNVHCAASETYQVSTAGVYEVDIMSNGQNCGVNGNDITLTVDNCVGLNDFAEGQDFFYPNPCSETLYLDKELTENNVVIYAANGGTVFQAENAEEINVSEWKSGVYLLSITSEGETITKKFVKE